MDGVAGPSCDKKSRGCCFLLARNRQLGPKAFAHDLCQSEFVLQDLSVPAKLMELSVQLLAFSFFHGKFLLEGCELDNFLFGHSP